ncbi:hypothetical protein [Oligella urethralis]|uniref:hypothetical protein n=1 Tax=Oligella urethralis TaxID=90245 RepID=UPI000DFEB82E|nr:hypothetical protein [Oligella urethralis]SUA57379.1 CRISPR-associated RAMP protein, Csx10 family [Oligella urethralis]
MRVYYRLTTQEPLVLSQSTATTNNHLGLDYIPGSAVLGAIASHLYRTLSEEQCFKLFHSGVCRFGPAYPLVNDEITLPMPASWHGVKDDAKAITNHSAPDFERATEKQYKQMRDGYITHQMDRASVEQGLTTRTALDEFQSPKDGQLYTYTTLTAGQEFGGWIEVDSEELLDQLQGFLNGELLIGRSRSSEFGRVKLSSDLQDSRIKTVKNLGKTLVLWCLSDAQCFNALGSPTFTPEISSVDARLKGSLNKAKSFIRTRKVRRFNRARQGLDSEQQLIAAGSVLVYDLDEAVSDEVLISIANQGIGSNRQQGLGWVAVNPAWADQAVPQSAGSLFEPIVLAKVEQQQKREYGSSALLAWVGEQLDRDSHKSEFDEQLKQLHHNILDAYENARRYHDFETANDVGPSSSQWRRLDELVKDNNTNWQQQAFNPESGVCKAKNDPLGWGIDWRQDGQHITFADFAKQKFANLGYEQMRLFIEQLCRYDLSSRAGLSNYKKHFLNIKNEENKA